jgi:ferredoxin
MQGAVLNLKRKTRRLIKKSVWNLFLSIFRLFIKMGPLFSYPLIGPWLKKMSHLEPEALTQGYTLNINADVTDQAKGVVLPIDMMKRMVKESSYRAIMNKCLCRSAHGCREFPPNHGCIFIGKGARGIVKNGIGREASIEEALAHIDKGVDLGLIGQALWVEVERFMMSLEREKDSAHWLEICFCCPCCCGTFRMIKSTNLTDIRSRFHSIGWKANVKQDCIRCHECIDRCPVNAISAKGDSIIIDAEKCLGCGFCAARCPQGAIKLGLEEKLLGNVQDYFSSSGLKVDL